MPRSSRAGELIFDPEVEKTARRLRKETQARKQAANRRAPDPDTFESTFSEPGTSDYEEEHTMAGNQTIQELAAPNLAGQPLCITFPALAENTVFELKPGLIHLLPAFHGLSGEDPHKHLQEFDVVCDSMRPPAITEEQIKL